MLDYKIATQEFTSWTVQYEWQKPSEHGEPIENLNELLNKAEEEDVQEEKDQLHWCRPTVQKKVKNTPNAEL